MFKSTIFFVHASASTVILLLKDFPKMAFFLPKEAFTYGNTSVCQRKFLYMGAYFQSNPVTRPEVTQGVKAAQ